MVIKKIKPAIAMIELIFSLVIIGIVLLSTPMLIQQSIRSSNVALQQESIAAAASHMGVILSMNWDEANANLPIGTSPILDTNRTGLSPTQNPLDFNGGSLPGLQDVSGRVSLVGGSFAFNPSLLAEFGANQDSNESNFTSFDDIDDYDGSSLGVTVYNAQNSSADIGDYVDSQLEMNSTIRYVEDRPSSFMLNSSTINLNSSIQTTIAVPTNIKMIKVVLTSNSGVAELDKNITLNAFSCNIGTFLPQGDTEL